ncbi:MAG TPA: cupin domain-containing protein [Pyrinomonadaceae bacterium]|nr:cupin domain-containing protein [Pyrinomonadaceae bacterium]
MALVTIFQEGRNEGETLRTPEEIAKGLAKYGIDYERWQPAHPVANDAPADAILNAYATEIEELKTRGGYVTADVIDVNPATPGLDAMLAKFNREHWHDEDEVRFIIAGHGLFHIHSKAGAVLAIEVEAGDLIRVPRGTLHWFNLCGDRCIRAIRLFQDTAGWTPHYTESQVDDGFLPVCFGGTHFPYQQP